MHTDPSTAPTKVTFPSLDGLTVTADFYTAADPVGFLVLCHRSHFNRGEYQEIAPRLNALGYSCLAIDQRSGMKVLGTTNETYQRAKEKGLATGYVTAKPDIQAALAHAFHLYAERPVILVGSSYSASLALLIASEDTSKLKAVVAFSPGEYLKGVTLAEQLVKLRLPTLVLSAKKEATATKALLQKAPKQCITHYLPASEGAHGARALWAKTPGHEAYWTALEEFLRTLI